MRSAARPDTHPPAALRRARSRRTRLAGPLLAAGLLLAATGCGSDGDSGTRPGAAGASKGGTAGPEPAGASSTVGLKVCSLVDFQPLLETVQGKFSVAPKDIKPGYGSDPGGPQCPAQLARRDGRTDFTGQLHLSVVPYGSEKEASGSFDWRMAGVRKGQGVSVRNLDGAWAKGTLASGGSNSSRISYALLRDGSLLYKAQLTWQAISGTKDIGFTAADVDTRIVDLVKELYTAVNPGKGAADGS
ncbi:hypothetical protein [Streptomyces palmae]|uniref:Uncharacterized protein n=1 Tax=Streptomyces palmae TaxID=1701085 RepID=A0A4Z0HCI1_9ACTN|nr:hypothetical protein [Streptomyces palmae]TGB13902.1 hypothetical protein E4099_09375 [Streptomyces palmae]